MAIRCKFKLDSIKRTANGGAYIEMFPVSSGSEENKQFYSEENKQFYKYTPSGQLVFGTVNEAVADQLKLGAEYYIDITPTDAPAT